MKKKDVNPFVRAIALLAVVGSALCATTAVCSQPEVYKAWPFDAQEASRRQEETAKALGVPKELVLELGGGVQLRSALVPAGRFMMGSPEKEIGRGEDEGPLREVTISRPFYMSVTHITQEQWGRISGGHVSPTRGPANPVEQVGWKVAGDFCAKLSQRCKHQVRLPTEAEWEYACRAGSAGRFYFGGKTEDLADYAWFLQNAQQKSHPAATKKPNAWGLYGMHGNLWQYCSDWYGEKYDTDSRVDPTGPATGQGHVVRGGSWCDPAELCRCAARSTESGSSALGFRIVVEVKP